MTTPPICPSWCDHDTDAHLAEGPVRCHSGDLSRLTTDGPGVTVTRFDSLTTGEPVGELRIGLRFNLHTGPLTVAVSRRAARRLSDSLDEATRRAAATLDAECPSCESPATASVLRANLGTCGPCSLASRHLHLVGTTPPEPTQPRPEPLDDHPRATVLTSHGDKATRAEVIDFAPTDWHDAAQLVRVRLGGDGYLTAPGARRLAELLTSAANDLDALSQGETA